MPNYGTGKKYGTGQIYGTPESFPFRFTSAPGWQLSTPGHISPGYIAGSLINSIQSGNATLSLIGTLAPALGRLISNTAGVFKAQLRILTFKAVMRTTSQIEFQPNSAVITTRETFPVNLDFSNYITGSDTITNITPELFFSNTVAVTSSWQATIPSVSSNVVQVNIDVTKLSRGVEYTLLCTVTLNTGKRLSGSMTLTVDI